MISLEDFKSKINTDGRIIDRLEEAYRYGAKMHEGQTRKQSDVPYFIHPVRVAIELGQEEDDVIIAGLLHDVVEDTSATLEDIESEFGPRVRALIRGLTKPSELDDADNTDPMDHLKEVAEEFEDVIKVKLADRIDNMTDNFDKMPESTKEKYVRQNSVLIDLAKERGITDFVEKLEEVTEKYSTDEKPTGE